MAARKGGNRAPPVVSSARSTSRKREVIVIGDVYWDTVVAALPYEDTDPENPGTDGMDTIYARRLGHVIRPAGAWLLERLIDQANCDEKFHVSGYRPVKDPGTKMRAWDEFLNIDKWPRAITRMKLFPKGVSGKTKEQVYRIEHVYGWIESCIPPKQKDYQHIYGPIFEKLNADILGLRYESPCRIVIINDDNLIFRYLKTSGDIVEKLVRQEKDWVVFVTTHPFEGGQLWKALEKPGLRERVALVISSTALRSRGHNVPQDVAIETEAYALWQHMHSVSELTNLMKWKHVLVRDMNGVFHFNTGTEKPFDYYFRPFRGGPEFNPRHYGWMSGYEKILVTSIVKSLLYNANTGTTSEKLFDTIGDGICAGLRLWTSHFDKGLSCHKFPKDYWKEQRTYEDPHPYDHLFSKRDEKNITEEAEKTKGSGIAWVQFKFSELKQIPGYTEEKLKSWSRVDWFREKIENKGEKFSDCLVTVVEGGLEKAIEKFSRPRNGNFDKSRDRIWCPVARFGDLEVVDQEEINGFLDVYRIILKYLEDDNWMMPLSLAVFGPPGAGKSFVVKEILKAARTSTGSERNDDAPVYNLAQFTKPGNLTTAFHQVQDKALSEEVPLIFFDEFDAKLGDQQYGWLKYFLAPMQDGKFKGADAEGSYRVGKAIFVFAGGTAKTFVDFKNNEAQNEGVWKLVKGPDFISRLRGYLNIKGINKTQGETEVSSLLAMRRAIILRSILTRKAKGIFDAPGKKARINKNLVNAFLWIGSYVHETRSMEAIVEMSRPEQGELRVASLPSREQLSMHVNDDDFLKLAGI